MRRNYTLEKPTHKNQRNKTIHLRTQMWEFFYKFFNIKICSDFNEILFHVSLYNFTM